ncbi:LysR family transcriptional regulator [Rhodobacterales bacterium 52_120_T64]|nr:LysR family transcriptional regulator [Rhodobacterales bacterium 52_120_T64]
MNISYLDWTHIQAFLAVADTGSLSAGARALGLSQPTLGRQVHAAEKSLGVELFHRRSHGLDLTSTGQTLLGPAKDMQKAAAKLSLAAEGRAEGLQGIVRITASEVISHFLLPRMLAGIRAVEPEIELELFPSDEPKNLLFREADIAVRMYRTKQLDIITRHIGNMKVGMFASRGYVEKRGKPSHLDEFITHDFIGYNGNDAIISGMRELGLDVDKHFFKVRCDQQVVHWELARAGCGIGFSQEFIGHEDPDMVQIMPELPLPSLPVWLTAPEVLRTNPRIRRVFDLLGESLNDMVDA